MYNNVVNDDKSDDLNKEDILHLWDDLAKTTTMMTTTTTTTTTTTPSNMVELSINKMNKKTISVLPTKTHKHRTIILEG